MALTCPQCAAQMNEVTAQAAVGYCILLDQCSRCGGIWCDRWELYPVTAAAAERLDPVDQEALWQPVAPAGGPLECPRCRARMSRFRDPALPQEARIERCPNCDGMWLNRGELRRFKGRAVGRLSNTVSDAELDRLTQSVSGKPPPSPTVSNLNAAFDATASDSDVDDIRSEIASGVGWLIARATLRLLLHI